MLGPGGSIHLPPRLNPGVQRTPSLHSCHLSSAQLSHNSGALRVHLCGLSLDLVPLTELLVTESVPSWLPRGAHAASPTCTHTHISAHAHMHAHGPRT